MKTCIDNRIVVSLRSVQYARFYYENQYGQRRDDMPYKANEDFFSVRNEWHSKQDIAYKGDGQTLWHMAKERGLLDVWTSMLLLCLTANQSLLYSGSKAQSIYKLWCEMQFSKKNKK